MQTPEEFLEAGGLLTDTLDRAGLLAAFNREMEEGLAGRPSSLAMLPTYVSPEGELRRDVPVTVLDAGGTNLRGATVSFPTGSAVALIEHKEKEQMPGATAYVSPDDFYATFAAHVRRTAPFAKSPDIGFCFSYACETAPNGDGKLLYWTKQIQAPEVIGQWVGAELAKRLDPKPPRLLVLNDTVTTLLAGKSAERDVRHSAYIGFILGTGTNVAYVEKNANILKAPAAPKDGTMVINAESGGFAKCEQSAFDRAMDAKTHDAGHQIFEKMIAGAYLGRLGLEVLKAAAKAGFFGKEAATGILSLGTLESMDLDNFCAGVKGDRANPLDRIFAASADRVLARRLATPVFTRAAILTAIHLAAFIVKTGGGTTATAPVCVCIDGSTYYKTRAVSFPKIVQRELEQMLGPRNISFELAVCPDDAPMVGAAVAVLLK